MKVEIFKEISAANPRVGVIYMGLCIDGDGDILTTDRPYSSRKAAEKAIRDEYADIRDVMTIKVTL